MQQVAIVAGMQISNQSMIPCKCTLCAQIQRAREEGEHLRQDAEEEARRSRTLEDEFDPDSARERKHHVKVRVELTVHFKDMNTHNDFGVSQLTYRILIESLFV